MGREIKRVHINFDLYERIQKNEKEGKRDLTPWKGYILDEVECPLCESSGKTLKNKECPLCDGSKKVSPVIEPPTGFGKEEKGYQVWEDVSEGSPVSPVFLRPEDLAHWMTENDDSITSGTSYKAWLKMIKEEGGCPSMMMNNKGIKSGMSLYEEDKDV